MRIDRNAAVPGPVIGGFAGGGFRVDDAVFRALVMTPERVEEWSPPPVDALTQADLGAALTLDPAPEFLLLGTGARLDRPAPSLVAALEARGIGVEAMDSRAAARAWGVLRGEGRWISAALYPLDRATSRER